MASTEISSRIFYKKPGCTCHCMQLSESSQATFPVLIVLVWEGWIRKGQLYCLVEHNHPLWWLLKMRLYRTRKQMDAMNEMRLITTFRTALLNLFFSSSFICSTRSLSIKLRNPPKTGWPEPSSMDWYSWHRFSLLKSKVDSCCHQLGENDFYRYLFLTVDAVFVWLFDVRVYHWLKNDQNIPWTLILLWPIRPHLALTFSISYEIGGHFWLI